LLQARLQGELQQVERVAALTSHQVSMVPWTMQPPIGVAALTALLDCAGSAR